MDWIRRNFGLKVAAVVIALVLWFTFNYLSVPQPSTKTVEVPLALHGVASTLVASTNTREVAVELAGARSTLASLAADDFVAYVDCSGKRTGTLGLAVSVVGPEEGKILSVTPATAVVVLDQYAYRRVPVITDAGTDSNITADVDPKSLVVAGAQSAVARVFAVQVSINEASVTKPVTVTARPVPVDVHLAVVNGVTTAPADVRVAIAPRKAGV